MQLPVPVHLSKQIIFIKEQDNKCKDCYSNKEFVFDPGWNVG